MPGASIPAHPNEQHFGCWRKSIVIDLPDATFRDLPTAPAIWRSPVQRLPLQRMSEADWLKCGASRVRCAPVSGPREHLKGAGRGPLRCATPKSRRWVAVRFRSSPLPASEVSPAGIKHTFQLGHVCLAISHARLRIAPPTREKGKSRAGLVACSRGARLSAPELRLRNLLADPYDVWLQWP